MTKTFLGVTVSCARCHDHKFDAISTKDYYALYGFVESSRYAQVPLDEDSEAAREQRAALDANRDVVALRLLRALRRRAPEVARYLRAADGVVREMRTFRPKDRRKRDARLRELLAKHAYAHGLDVAELRRWHDAIPRPQKGSPLTDFARRWAEDRVEGRKPGAKSRTEVFADFQNGNPRGWRTTGSAFDPALRSSTTAIRLEGDRVHMRQTDAAAADSGRVTALANGGLFSPSFVLDQRWIHIRAAGRDGRINIVPEGFTLLRNPIWGRFKLHITSPEMRWYRIDTKKHTGLRVALELLDQSVADPADPFRRGGYAKDSWLRVERIVLSDDDSPPTTHIDGLLEKGDTNPERVVRAFVSATYRAVDAALAGKPTAPQRRWLSFLGGRGLLLDVRRTANDDPVLGALLEKRRRLEDKLRNPRFALALIDGSPVDHPVHIRGSHRHPGDVVEARFLQALGACTDATTLRRERSTGSGRLALAKSITSAENPLTARVFANRIWHHLLGRGLVATTDNFGVLGETPSHPRLLDWLAHRVRDDGWSRKKMIRRIVLSSTYRMGSTPRPDDATAIAKRDPENRMLHKVSVRRLTGESIRDSMLAVSGRLDLKRFGPGVPVHLTKFLKGRGRPGRSGPLDGAGRRSLWLEVRRNFLNPFFLAFDRPSPVSTFGRRSRSNVPAQALSLLNDPFVQGQAKVWGKRVSESGGAIADKVHGMFTDALGREPTKDELERCTRFVRDREEDPEEAWADLAHVMFNLKEFAWIR